MLSTLVPYYLNHLKGKKDGNSGEVDVKKEMKHMRYLIKYVATIIELYEHLRKYELSLLLLLCILPSSYLFLTSL